MRPYIPIPIAVLALATFTTVLAGPGPGPGGDKDDFDDWTSSWNDDRGGQRNLRIKSTRLFLAHMILMTLAWMGCFPLGILIARYGRTSISWLPAHRAMQSFGLLLVVAGFALAVAGVHYKRDDHISNTHERLGLALCILLLLQIALGMLAHFVRHRSGSRIIGFVHAPFGLFLVGMSIWTVHEGFKEWEWNAPNYARYILYAWMALMGVLYLFGMLCCGRERRYDRERSERMKQAAGPQATHPSGQGENQGYYNSYGGGRHARDVEEVQPHRMQRNSSREV